MRPDPAPAHPHVVAAAAAAPAFPASVPPCVLRQLQLQDLEGCKCWEETPVPPPLPLAAAVPVAACAARRLKQASEESVVREQLLKRW